MRIWHEDIIPKLCQKHLCAMWRESLGAYKIITENRTELSYWKHPATQEFVDAPMALWQRMAKVQGEMLYRGYHPKALPMRPKRGSMRVKEWQTLEEQIEHLKSKNCKCKI